MDLVKFKDNKITEISTNVENFDDSLKTLVDNMIKVMHKYDGIGLAAIQIGIPQRVIVVEVQPGQILVAINPEIIWKSEKFSEMKEANLSLDDGIKVLVRRSAEIKIKYQDLDGNWQELKATGMLSTCIQHEMEQMDGITILNHKK